MRHPSRGIILAALALPLCTTNAFGFAEEPIAYLDPASMEVWEGEESTVHNELTYVLALAAGFSTDKAARIAIWDQLVDSEKLGANGSTVYTNCLGSFGAPPDPAVVCPGGAGDGEVVWPMSYDSTCATSRFGPYSPFFHFPHDTAAQLGALKEWGWGRSQTLMGYAAYAWGSMTDTVLTAACRYMRPEVVHTGITPGSLEAFGTYIHCLADHYSHNDCMSALDALDLTNLWGTHTVTLSDDTAPCYYIPARPSNSDAHGQEFGDGKGTYRTEGAAAAVFDELVWRSTQWEGSYSPLSMDTVLTGMSGEPTLRQAVSQFIRNWNFQREIGGSPGDFAQNRRDYSGLMATAVLSLRTALPAPTCASGPVWLGGVNYFPNLQAAYAGMGMAGTMKIAGSGLPAGDFNLSDGARNFSITLKGGYNCDFSSQSGYSTVDGTVTVGFGSVVLENIIVR